MKLRSDVERILFARGQEEEYTADELYGLIAGMRADEISSIRQKMKEQQFHLMSKEQRFQFINTQPEFASVYKIIDYEEVFTDFRCNGYRLLGDIICDYDDRNTAQQRKENALRSNTDRELLDRLMGAHKAVDGIDYEKELNFYTRRYIREKSSAKTALKCAIALGKRQFAYEALLYEIEYELKEDKNAKRKRGIPRLHW